MGAVVGPHGVGKSALITALAEWMEQHQISCLRVELHDGQRTLDQEIWNSLEDRSEIVLMVDGFEQLSTWTRYQLRRLCRKRRLGLIGTAHSDVELPLLYAPEPNEDLAWKIVQLLLQRGEPLITREDVHESFARHQGNLREMLFDLYDLYELRRSNFTGHSAP
jgi:GTPase SAR1 family protein